MKSIDNLSRADAKQIFHDVLKLNPRSFTDVEIKTRVRKYLRTKKQSPTDCIKESKNGK